MSLAGLHPTGKAKLRLRPLRVEGCYIKYQLSIRGCSFSRIGQTFDVSVAAVRQVAYGLSRSAKIEAEIARILGKQSWNDVVQEARAATSGVTTSRLRQERRVAG